jgi:hypothetical protein
MIDDHLATWHPSSGQPHNERPTSSGTMIVDWDGIMEPVVTYRRKSQEDVLGPLIPPAPPPPLNRGGGFGRRVDGARQGRMDPTAYKRKALPLLPTDQRAPSVTAASSHNDTRHYSAISDSTRTASPRHALHGQTSTQTPAATNASSQSSVGYPQPMHSHYKTADGFTASYLPPHAIGADRPAYIKGYDASTRCEYDYNGRILHVHRSPSSHPSYSLSDTNAHTSQPSIISEYYAVDVEKYNAHADVRVQDKEVVPTPVATPVERGRKRRSVVRFVEKVLWRLAGFGLMGMLRRDRKEEVKWRDEGYVT